MSDFDPYKIEPYISNRFSKIKVQGVYAALLLFYAFKNKETPKWAKNIIIGALAYFVSPIDSIPDLTPFLGFTDDIGVMMFGLVTIACYIDDEIRKKARITILQYFGTVDLDDLNQVDAKL